MNDNELKEIILAGLKQIAPADAVDGLKPDDKFLQKLDLDSFDHLNFLVAISSQIGIEIPEKDYGKLVAAAVPLVKAGGVLFASTNAAGWPPEEFLRAVMEGAPNPCQQAMRGSALSGVVCPGPRAPEAKR